MIANRNVPLDNLITIDDTGVNVATFLEVKAALIEKYKSIYGSDIDLSTGNADGEFVNELSLMINNILQSVKNLYSNLDVNTAAGSALDSLCALSNVYRKPATNSIATIILTNNSGSAINIASDLSTFQDQSGMIWNYNGSPFTLENLESKTITIEASETGPIEANPGWINIFVGQPYVDIEQTDPAIVGENEESDTELRSRRNQYISPVGTTVLQSLSASLLSVAAVKDVKIYNNQDDQDQAQSSDGTDTLAHGIYIIVRQTDPAIKVDDEIGDLIYNKLTPGIRTTESAASTSKSKVYTPTMLGLTVSDFQDTIYWRLTEAIHPTITITYTEIPGTGFAPNTGEELASALKEYLNELSIGKVPTQNEIIMELLMADPRQKGPSTFTIGTINITDAINNNLDNYYNYTIDNDVIDDHNPLLHTLTLN